ncbi:MAG: cytochrome c peroxidase [Candidatus Sericytochromatia bacterium]
MKKIVLFTSLLFLSSCSAEKESIILNTNNNVVSQNKTNKIYKKYTDSELRSLYSKPISQWQKADLDNGVTYKELGLLPVASHPSNNPLNNDKVELGKLLFFDTRLSKYGMFSCSTCHNPEHNWADNLDRPLGNDKNPLKRNSPTVANTAYFNTMFWDGRAKSLEQQAHDVLLNPREMNSNENLIKRSIGDDELYLDLFKKSFGDSEITFDRVTFALATFQRTITTKNNSPFDQFIKGNYKALNDPQIRGLHLFRTKARCMNCHQGANFSDNNFHNTGLVMQGTEFEDLGKFDTTKLPEDFGTFRTASLRNVVKTAPYFHHGQTKTIKEILDMYNKGMPEAQNKSKLIKPLGLSNNELEDLESFLNSLSESLPTVRKPIFRK